MRMVEKMEDENNVYTMAFPKKRRGLLPAIKEEKENNGRQLLSVMTQEDGGDICDSKDSQLSGCLVSNGYVETPSFPEELILMQ